MPLKLSRFLVLLFANIISYSLYAQQYGFEWIKPSQPYYKFSVGNTGVARITPVALLNSGIDLNNISPNRFQFFYQGKEVAVYISGTSDGKFNGNDFIEFPVFKNNGTIDSTLYADKNWQPNLFNGLFTDTSVYFLTILPDETVLPLRYAQVNDFNFAGLQPETYFTDTAIVAPAQEYLDGPDVRSASEKYVGSEYDLGEGWASERIGWDQNKVFTLRTPSFYATGPAPQIEFKIIGASDALRIDNSISQNHHAVVEVSPDNVSYSGLSNETFKGYEVKKYNYQVNPASIGSTTYLRVNVLNDLQVRADNVCLSYAIISYPRQYSLNGERQKLLRVLHQGGGSRSYIVMQDIGFFNQNNATVFDLTSLKRISTSFNNRTAQFVVTNDGKPHDIFLYDTTNTINISRLTPVAFPVINPSEAYEFLIISHPSLEPAADNYATYRSNKYKTLKVYSEQLYDYYYYGNRHPHAVQRFARHLIKTQQVAPQYMLLAGRGYQNDKARFYSISSKEPVKNYNNNLVPAIGVPGADAVFTNGINGNGFYAEIPTGRISATSSQDLQNYLDKLIAYETSPDSILPWRKKVLHVSGGSDLNQQLDFKNQLKNYGQHITGDNLGASIVSFSKSTNSPTQVDLKDQIVDVQNKGVGLVSFLGHASYTIIDVNMGSIGDLMNQNKYPFYYFSGCNVGNATEEDPGTGALFYSKDYICTANKGAIGWLAHANFTFTDQLPPIMNSFYSRYSKLNYGESIGTIMMEINKQLSNGSASTRTSNLQWVLQGDPAMVLYSPSAPDYTLAPNDVFVTSTNLSAQSEFLDIGIIVSNNGKTADDSLSISVRRRLPDNKLITYPVSKYNSVFNKDTFYFRMEMLGDLALGNNAIEINVDALNEVDEIFENNNSVSTNVFVPGNGIRLLYPQQDAVVGNDTAWIVVQNNNVLSTANEFIIEVDITPDFSSGTKVNSGIVKANSLLKWPLKITATDTTTYYWRARLNVNEQEGGRWAERAFTYIPDHDNAWMQRTFPRLIDLSASELLLVDTPNQKWDFSENTTTVSVYASYFAHSGRGVWTGENQNPGIINCVANGLGVVLFDQRTLQPFINPKFPLNCQNVIDNNQNPANRKLYYYAFGTDGNSQAEFQRFIDSVDQGTYVSIFSLYSNGNTQWTPATRQAFQKLGSTKVAALNQDTSAFVLLGQKGAVIGTIPEDTFYSTRVDTFAKIIDVVLYGKWFTAGATTKTIGPAQSWGSLSYQYGLTENNGHDHNTIKVIGVNEQNVDTILMNNAGHGTNLSSIDAAKYPYLKLELALYDTTYRTPDQINYWMVKYEPVPEGTISVNDSFAFYASQLEQGDSVSLSLAFRNISTKAFDSVPVLLRVLDASRQVKFVWNENLGSMPVDGVVKLSKKISTYDFDGQYGLEVYLNDGPQAELTKVNNYLYKPFFVKADKRNPLLDVTFDGYRIVNGDFISPKPVIRITSKDDSKFKLQDDTSSFSLFLRKPDDVDYVQLTMADADLLFKPAKDENNKAELEYRPEFKQNGLYSLKVMSRDASGNFAGGNFYEVDFTVESKSTITNFFPYPNPATTNVRFVFTLTGAAPPDQLLIRIMTVSGRVVKEITKDEFGPIKIGQNMSQYSWDGTDNYGDRLANGVYLYQVFTRINGNGLEKRQTIADRFFLENVGKIYLMK